VVAEHRVNRPSEMRPEVLKPSQGGLAGAEGPRSIISRDDTKVIFEWTHTFDQRVDELRIDVDVEV
jgi:hypothetical protein